MTPRFVTPHLAAMLGRLELPPNRVIVIGSGILDKLGIRASHDIDLVVDEELFVALAERNDLVAHEDERGIHYQTRDDFVEVWRTWGLPGGAERTFAELLSDTQTIDGIRYVTLDYVKRWKQSRERDKDERDIELIERYEAAHA